jgi:VWFA-related protein
MPGQRHFASALALCAALVLSGAAQAPPRAREQAMDAPPTMRVTTRLVQVDVVARDARGQFVRDLRAEDFILLENGKEQAVSVFAVHSRSDSAPDAPAAPPAGTVTNRPALAPGPPPVISVVLFDALNTQIRDQLGARVQVVEFLKSIAASDRVAIYVLGNTLQVVHDFTSHSAALVRAVHDFYATAGTRFENVEPGILPSGVALFADFAAQQQQRMEAQFIEDRVKFTCRAIEAIAQHLARIPGRKNLIWVSAGFPLATGLANPSEFESRFDTMRAFHQDAVRASRALSQAGIAVYPIDARGLFTLPANYRMTSAGAPALPAQNTESSGGSSPQLPGQQQGGGNSAGGGGGGGGRTAQRSPSRQALNAATRELAALRDMPEAERTQPTMRFLANLTGGRAFYNRNDLARAIREAMDDAQVSYLLGYYPANRRWDGGFREIKVRSRRAGITLRHRLGYFAYPDAALSESEGRALLESALGVPFGAGAVGLTASLARAAGPDSVKLSLRVEPDSITLNGQGEAYVGAVDMLLSLVDAQGKELWSNPRRISLQLKPATRARMRRDGFHFTIELPVKPAAAELRIAVCDVPSGRIGTLRAPLAALTARP